MKPSLVLAAAALPAALATAAFAQTAPSAADAPLFTAPDLGEIMVSTDRASAPYARQDRPVIGLRRRADGAVMSLYISSDTREAATRTQEIHAVLLSAMDKAAATGLEIVSGGIPLERVTRDNYKLLPLLGAGRVDTSKVHVLIKAPLGPTAGATQARLSAFVNSLKGTGRATVSGPMGIALTMVNPDRHRDTIVGLVAAEARRNAALFGPEFTFSLTGIDSQIIWSQVSATEVFLFIPYRYTILPKR